MIYFYERVKTTATKYPPLQSNAMVWAFRKKNEFLEQISVNRNWEIIFFEETYYLIVEKVCSISFL